MQALQTLLSQAATTPLTTPAASAPSVAAHPVALQASPSESLALAKDLTRCLALPTELPAALLRSDEVELSGHEKHELWAVVEKWAKTHKRTSINTAVHKHNISAAQQARPWPTAEHIWHAAVNQGLSENPGFVVDDWLRPVLLALCLYFAQDQQGFEELSPAYSLQKGLLLFGPVGCGKTKLLELLTRVDSRLAFRVYACPDVSRAYRKDGDEALEIYGAARTMCFDDLGFEDANAKHYGSSTNPLADVLTRRYQLTPRPLTHATTNDDAATMLDKYGQRVASRMSEMFNIIQFSPDAPDRRLT